MSLQKIKRKFTHSMRQLFFWFAMRFAKASRWADNFRHLADKLEDKRLREFLQKTDFETLDTSDYEPMYISAGFYRFQLFDTFFLKTMLAYTLHCLYRSHLPCVDVCTRSGDKRNIWEQFLEQPFHKEPGESVDGSAEGICPTLFTPLRFPLFPTDEDVRLFAKLARPPFFKLNEKTSAYVEREFNEVFFRGGGAIARLRRTLPGHGLSLCQEPSHAAACFGYN